MAPQTPFTVAAVHAASEFLDLDASIEKAARSAGITHRMVAY